MKIFCFTITYSSTLSSVPLYSDGKVEPLDPPSGSKPGDKIFVEGYTVEASGAGQLVQQSVCVCVCVRACVCVHVCVCMCVCVSLSCLYSSR